MNGPQLDPTRLDGITIVGGGTAGWMAAAALSHVLKGKFGPVRLVESAEIGTVGVGEATIPSLAGFHRMLGIDETEFLKRTGASFKLGIEFRDWREPGAVYFHPFGGYAPGIDQAVFQSFWLRARAAGDASRLETWSLNSLAAELRRFAPDAPPVGPLSYAYHFDASHYARYLRDFAEARGVERVEGRIAGVEMASAERIAQLRLEDGRTIGGELFLDCSGFHGLILDRTLEEPFEDWSHWLPCDRAVAIGCEPGGDFTPFTRSTALEAGWRWRIPLQHRIGNGYVYSSGHLSDDEAAARLLASLEAPAIGEPRLLRFKAGRRRRAWVGNCVALGLAAGFLEPLESTSIHLIQTGIGRLLSLFPDRAFDASVAREYNRLTALEYERIRDFIVLHYTASRRDDTPFWRDLQAIELPAELAYCQAVFERTGRTVTTDADSFQPASWLAIYAGNQIWPERHEPLADRLPQARLEQHFASIKDALARSAAAMPPHIAYLSRRCP